MWGQGLHLREEKAGDLGLKEEGLGPGLLGLMEERLGAHIPGGWEKVA